jgi:hypothetical protein
MVAVKRKTNRKDDLEPGAVRRDDRRARPTPADYLAAGVLAGTAGTIALAALSRFLLQRADAAAAGDRAAVEQRRPSGRGGLRRSPGRSSPLVVLSRIGTASDETPAPGPDGHPGEAGPESASSGKGSAGGRQ